MERILYVACDNLNESYGVLKEADPKRDLILFVESARMLGAQKWHYQRLYFMISAARHFAEHLRSQGFEVHYLKSATTKDGIKELIKSSGIKKVVAAEPSSHRLYEDLRDLVEYIPNDFFLTSRAEFMEWAGSQKKLLMENFYRIQRKRLKILMKGDKPVGDKWNFDAENRGSVPNGYKFPKYLTHEFDPIDKKVIAELDKSKLELWGEKPDGTWSTTRDGALKQLKYFLSKHLKDFGPLEDAMTTENWALHHSLLSPYLNLGILHAREVISETLNFAKKNEIPIQSLEGFIRQIIGWREYVNGLYWFFGPDYKNSNFWGAKGKLLPMFEDSEKTEMNCIKTIVGEIEDRAWVHHIPRLMVLSNLAQLTDTSPQEFLAWMRRVFIDASDWVMVPNVIGMSMHADGGRMMSKPYLAGGAYISRMSNYCKGCRFDPKKRTGTDACPFTVLYWNHVDKHFETLRKNPRLAQQVHGIKRLNDVPEIKVEAEAIIKKMRSGK